MEIERKFLVKDMPNLTGKSPVCYERYYLKREQGIEERIQKKNEFFEYELKKEVSALERTKDKKQITEQEFNVLKNNATEALIRDSYQIRLDPEVTIKIYHGRFEGLVRAEVEFSSIEEARKYEPESWMGQEITETPLGRDAKLLDLTDDEFKKLIA